MSFGGKEFQALIDKVSNVDYSNANALSEKAYEDLRKNQEADIDALMLRANAIDPRGGTRFDYDAFMDEAKDDDNYYATVAPKAEEKRLTSDYFNEYLQNYFNNPIFKFESKTTNA